MRPIIGSENKVLRKRYDSAHRSSLWLFAFITIAGARVPGFNGDGGQSMRAQIRNTMGIAVDSGGNLYVGGQYGTQGDVGSALLAAFENPAGIVSVP